MKFITTFNTLFEEFRSKYEEITRVRLIKTYSIEKMYRRSAQRSNKTV